MHTALMKIAASGRNYDCKIVDLVKVHLRFGGGGGFIHD